MDNKIKLVSEGVTLTILAESDWLCHVYLTDGKRFEMYHLGVASVDYVCSHLITGISKETMLDEVTFKRDNLEVFWIMSLFVGHASLYGSVSAEGLKLFCQDEDGHDLIIINMEWQCIKQWVEQLSEFRKRYQL